MEMQGRRHFYANLKLESMKVSEINQFEKKKKKKRHFDENIQFVVNK